MKNFLTTLFFSAAFILTAADMLPNSGFKKIGKNGIPANWSLRDTPVKKGLTRNAGNKAVTVKDDILTLDTCGGRFEVMLINFHTPVKAGKTYNFTFDVRGIGAVNYRALAYWTTQKDGKTVWQATSTGKWTVASKEWKPVSITFTVAPDKRDAYIYLAANGPGKAEFRNVRLRDAGVDIAASNDLSVYLPGEKVVFKVDNLLSPANSVNYKLTDFYEKNVDAGAVDPGMTITFNNLPNGWYILDVEEKNTDGKAVAARRRTFSVIPEVPDSIRTSPKNQFGAMVNPHTWYPMDQRTMDARFMHRIGIRYVRTHRLNWPHIQSGKDKPFNWDTADEQVRIYKQYGLMQVATLGWPCPGWASDAYGKKLARTAMFMPRKEFQDVQRKLYSELAKRYKGSVAYYEIGNEIDASNFWLGSVENFKNGNNDGILQDYIDHYILVAKSLKEGDPDALVGPGVTGAMPLGHTYRPWMERFWKSPAINYTDIFCPHYGTSIPAIRKVMDKHGKRVPIVLTEIGGLVKTETYKESPELLRKIIKLTYSLFLPRLNLGGKALCNFLLRRIPEVREGWISEMLDADYTQRPEYAAYATLIRLTGDGDFEKELNLTHNASSGWVEAYRVRSSAGIVNVIMLQDTVKADVTLKTNAGQLKIVDVMGRERTVPVKEGKLVLPMQGDIPVFVIGELLENPGPVKHPEPQMVLKKELKIANPGFEEPVKNNRIPGWVKLVDERGLKQSGSDKVPFTVALENKNPKDGKNSLHFYSDFPTKWYGVLCHLPVRDIPVPKAGQYVIFKISYDQKGEKVIGTGAGLTLAFHSKNMERVDFGGGNWHKGSFDWTHKVWTSRKYDHFHRDTRFITLEFYLGEATGKVWIDNVKVEVELWQKSNAAAGYIN